MPTCAEKCYIPVTEQPCVRAETEVLAHHRADAAREARAADVEVRSGDRPLLPAPAERDIGPRGQARERVEAVLRVVRLRAGDRLVERRDLARGPVDERRARDDDR